MNWRKRGECLRHDPETMFPTNESSTVQEFVPDPAPAQGDLLGRLADALTQAEGMISGHYVEQPNPDIVAAKAVCGSCVVREACLEWALDHHIGHGVWGGMTTPNRDAERRRRYRARKKAAAKRELEPLLLEAVGA